MGVVIDHVAQINPAKESWCLRVWIVRLWNIPIIARIKKAFWKYNYNYFKTLAVNIHENIKNIERNFGKSIFNKKKKIHSHTEFKLALD